MAEAADTGDADKSGRTNQLLQCPVCLERFTDPKALPCQHTFCKTCLETLVDNDNNIIRCPQCRAVHILSADGISGLVTNYTIVNLMDINQEKHACAECATETIQSDLTACPHCGDVICPVCSVSHFTEMKESLFITSQHIHADVGRIRDARNKLAADLSQLKQKSETVKSEINKCMDRFIVELRDRQKGLCEQVDVYVNNMSSSLQSHIVRVEAELASRLSLSASVDSGMAKILSNIESSIENLMSITAQCSDYNDQDDVNLSSSSQNRSNPNVNFVPINAHELSQSILKFGEITTETRESNLSTQDGAMVTRRRNVYHERQGKVLIDKIHRGWFSVFSSLEGIAVSPAGDRIYVTVYNNNTLHIFDARGRHIKAVSARGGGVGECNYPTGIAVNNDGDVMVSDTFDHRIIVFNREGEYLFMFGEEGYNDGQLNKPWGLTVDITRNIYVCDTGNHRVQVFSRDGTFLRKMIQPGSVSGVFSPLYIAIAHDTGRVYVTDSNNHRVHVYSTQGEYISCFGSEGSADGEMKHPCGICVDDAGDVILTDAYNNRLQVFHADGTFLCKLSSYGADETRLSRPRGLTVDKNNRVFVTDRGNKRVIVF